MNKLNCNRNGMRRLRESSGRSVVADPEKILTVIDSQKAIQFEADTGDRGTHTVMLGYCKHFDAYVEYDLTENFVRVAENDGELEDYLREQEDVIRGSWFNITEISENYFDATVRNGNGLNFQYGLFD